MSLTTEMKKLVLKTSDSNTLMRHAVEEDKMITLQMDGLTKAIQGVTTIEEVYRVCHA